MTAVEYCLYCDRFTLKLKDEARKRKAIKNGQVPPSLTGTCAASLDEDAQIVEEDKIQFRNKIQLVKEVKALPVTAQTHCRVRDGVGKLKFEPIPSATF